MTKNDLVNTMSSFLSEDAKASETVKAVEQKFIWKKSDGRMLCCTLPAGCEKKSDVLVGHPTIYDWPIDKLLGLV